MDSEPALDEERVQHLAARAFEGKPIAGQTRWWLSEGATHVVLRRGEAGYRIPIHMLDRPPEEVAVEEFRVGFAPLTQTMDVLDRAIVGSASAEEVEERLARVLEESRALDRDLGKDFEIARRLREGVAALAEAPAMLRRGDRKAVLLALLAAQQALQD